MFDPLFCPGLAVDESSAFVSLPVFSLRAMNPKFVIQVLAIYTVKYLTEEARFSGSVCRESNTILRHSVLHSRFGDSKATCAHAFPTSFAVAVRALQGLRPCSTHSFVRVAVDESSAFVSLPVFSLRAMNPKFVIQVLAIYTVKYLTEEARFSGSVCRESNTILRHSVLHSRFGDSKATCAHAFATSFAVADRALQGLRPCSTHSFVRVAGDESSAFVSLPSFSLRATNPKFVIQVLAIYTVKYLTEEARFSGSVCRERNTILRHSVLHSRFGASKATCAHAFATSFAVAVRALQGLRPCSTHSFVRVAVDESSAFVSLPVFWSEP